MLMSQFFWSNFPSDAMDNNSQDPRLELTQDLDARAIHPSSILFTELGSNPDAEATEPITTAADWSQKAFNPAQQWQVYLHRLALFGLETWLQERLPQLSLQQSQCSLLRPALANVLAAVTRLRVGDFQLCLLATGTEDEEILSLPRAVVECPNHHAHFYLVMEVLEEQGVINLRGFLTYPQLQQLQATGQLIPQADWSYSFPSQTLTTDIEQLLLYLQCLHPNAIRLPAPAEKQIAQPTIQLQTWLQQMPTWAPQLRSQPLWQILTWEQGALLFNQPELLTALYDYQAQFQTQAVPTNSLLNQLSQKWQRLTQAALKQWQTTTTATQSVLQQGLDWLLLPDLELMPAGLRSWQDATVKTPVAELERLLRKLQANGLTTTPKLTAAYQDITLAAESLRLYAATWPILSTGANSATPNAPPNPAADRAPAEWGRLLIVSRASTQPLPRHLPGGLKLEVFNQSTETNELVVSHQIAADAPEPYLYVYFLATWSEQITVQLSLADGTCLDVPPLVTGVDAL
jgi:hypothetical protein